MSDDADIEYLKKNAKKGSKPIAEALGVTANCVRKRAMRYGISLGPNNAWGAEEVTYLKENCNKLSYTKMGKKLGRTAEAVRYKARMIGVAKSSEQSMQGNWTESDDAILIAEAKKGAQFLSEVLGKGIRTIERRAQALGISLGPTNYWSSEHTNYLIEHYQTQTPKQIGKHINRSEYAVYKKISALGLRKK